MAEWYEWFLWNIGFEGGTAILLLLYFLFFQLPKIIMFVRYTSKYGDRDVGGNDNIGPRGPQDYR